MEFVREDEPTSVRPKSTGASFDFGRASRGLRSGRSEGPGEPPRALVRFERLFAQGYFPVFHRVEFRVLRAWPESGPLIVAANHPSYFDPFVVGMRMKRYVYWMAWASIFTWPLIGALTELHRALPVDLERPKPSTLRRALAVLESGEALGVFPEGERTSGENGEMDPWKPGLARLGLETGAPILPVSIKGARRCWPKGRPYPLPGKIVVTYHPVVDPRPWLEGAPRSERETALTAQLARTIACAL
ncbi:1-acyl-sn-glycerol-3-phosphate acyltransferase [bacterium]|nr:1-acyl-sn-glycerol-3-phosphate acyltransferase [bacterium]